jgi:hypothetical protein
MKPSQLFKDVRYLGEAEGDRKTYYVFETSAGYLVLGPTSAGGYYLNAVDKEAPEVVTRAFRGKQVTTTLLKGSSRRPGRFHSSLAALNVLYVMVALRRARKLKKRRGKAMVFKIR